MNVQERASREQLVLESARIYHSRAVPVLFEPWGRRLLDDVPLGPGQRALDVACGSGAVTRLAAARVGVNGSVTGVDLNPGMIETARETNKDVHPAIDFQVGDATDLPFPDAAFDVVLCQQGVQFVPAKADAIREMHRVLKPNGWAAFTQWIGLDYMPAYRVLCEALDRHVNPTAGDVMRTPFQPEDGTGLRRVTEEAGFPDVRHVVQVGSVRFPSVAEFTQLSIDAVPPGPKGHLKSMYESVGADDRKALFEEIARNLEPFRDDMGVCFPMTTHLIVARK